MHLLALLIIPNLSVCYGHFENADSVHNKSEQYCFPENMPCNSTTEACANEIFAKCVISQYYRHIIQDDPTKDLLTLRNKHAKEDYTFWKTLKKLMLVQPNLTSLKVLTLCELGDSMIEDLAKNNLTELYSLSGDLIMMNGYKLSQNLLTSSIMFDQLSKHQLQTYVEESTKSLEDYVTKTKDLMNKKSQEVEKYIKSKKDELDQIKKKYTFINDYDNETVIMMINQDIDWVDKLLVDNINRTASELEDWTKLHNNKIQEIHDENDIRFSSVPRETKNKIIQKLILALVIQRIILSDE